VPVGFSLLALGAASAWWGPDGSDRLDWMIIGMINAHSIQNRMARCPEPDAQP